MSISQNTGKKFRKWLKKGNSSGQPSSPPTPTSEHEQFGGSMDPSKKGSQESNKRWTKQLSMSLGVGKQYVKQKMGKGDKTKDPEEYAEIKKDYHQLVDHYRKAVDAGRKHVHHSEGVASAESVLGETWSDFGSSFYENEVGSMIKKCGDTFKALATLRIQLHTKMQEDYVASLGEYIEDIKVTKEAKSRYIRRRLEHDTIRERLAHVKGDMIKTKKVQEELDQAKDSMDEAYEEAFSEVEYQLEKRDLDYREEVRKITYAYMCYFETGMMMMRRLEPLLKAPEDKPRAKRKTPTVHTKKHTNEKKGDSTRVFGVSLDEILSRERENGSIPRVAELLIDYMERNAVQLEGVFRVPGNNPDVMRIQAIFDKGKEFDFDSLTDVHVAGTLLKKFVRDMPEPLLTHDLYDQWLSCAETKDRSEAIPKIQQLLCELPSHNLKFLQLLMGLLHQVTEHAEENKMSAANLAIVFGLNILSPEDDSPMRLAKDTAPINHVCELLIDNFHDIFDHLPEKDLDDHQQNQNQHHQHHHSGSPPMRPLPKHKSKKPLPSVGKKTNESSEGTDYDNDNDNDNDNTQNSLTNDFDNDDSEDFFRDFEDDEDEDGDDALLDDFPDFTPPNNTNNTNNTNTGSSSVASSSTNPFESHSSSSSPPLPHPQQRRPPPAPPKEEHDLDDFL